MCSSVTNVPGLGHVLSLKMANSAGMSICQKASIASCVSTMSHSLWHSQNVNRRVGIIF